MIPLFIFAPPAKCMEKVNPMNLFQNYQISMELVLIVSVKLEQIFWVVYGEAYNIKTFITRMGTHSGRRRSDVFFESTVAKQIALIEAGFQEPVIKVGNLSSVRTFQDTRDAIRAYYLLAIECEKGNINPGEVFNIAGEEVFKLPEIIDILISLSSKKI